MRILGFGTMWSKLNNDLLFTTFRFPRKDKDWQVEEMVQVVFKPRSKLRKPLGIARIIRKDVKDLSKTEYYYYRGRSTSEMVTPEEAAADGFTNMWGNGDIEKMLKYFMDSYGVARIRNEPMNKLTLYWISNVDNVLTTP